jgi:ligand-binding sensor domain-containing protein/AraC-like DNA-binding protein
MPVEAKRLEKCSVQRYNPGMKKPLRFVGFICLFTWTIFSADSLQYLSKTWNSSHGLPQNTVNCMVKDNNGFLWLGTESGLVRFDGKKFNSLDTITNSKNLNKTTALMLASDGKLWIGTEGRGIAVLRDNKVKYYSTADGLPAAAIRAIAEDRDRTIHFASTGKGLIQFRDNTFTTFSTADGLSNDNVTSITVDDDGHLWVGTENGLNHLSYGKCMVYGAKDGLPNNHVTSLFLGKDGILRIGTITGMAAANNPTNGTMLQSLEQMNGHMVFSILEDRNGILWVATDRGMYYMTNPGTNNALVPNRSFVFGDGPRSASVISLYEDTDGILWFGTKGRGFGNRYPSSFRFYTTSDGLSHNDISAIYQDEEETVWIGTRGGGLNRFKNGTFESYTQKNGLSSNWITSIYGDKNSTIWIGTPGGLNRFKDGKFSTFTTAHGLSSSSIRSLYVDHIGNTWIGTNGAGLNLFNPEDGTFSVFGAEHGLSNLFVTVITSDKDWNLWVGTCGGIFLFRNGRFRNFTTKDGLFGNKINDICTAPDGTVWIVSCCGLNRYRQGAFTAFKNCKLLSGAAICRVLEDNSRQLWLTTVNGLFRVPEDELKHFPEQKKGIIDHCFFGDGALRTTVFSSGGQPAGWKTTDGDLWLPTVDGITVVPGTWSDTPPLPRQKLLIETLLVNDTETKLAKAKTLPSRTKKVEFLLNAPNYTAPETLRFKFRLERNRYDLIGNTWPDGEEVEISRATRKVYDNLSPGRFVFTAVVGGVGGEWNEGGRVTVKFTIRRPFIETPWFYLMLFISGLAAAAFILFYSRRRAKERALFPSWENDDKYKTFSLSKKESRLGLRKLLEIMEKEKPFLSPDITLPELGKRIDMSKEELSQVINRELHLNFNAFINRYRIEEAKRKLRDPKENQFVVLKIAYEVGFNSKSSFNAVFKRMTGMSPSEYRYKYQN